MVSINCCSKILTYLDGLITRGLKVDGYDEYELQPSVHVTYNFNVFVMMTFFNFINARKLEDEYNVLGGLCNGSYFLPILAIIFVLQILIITFGGLAFRCAPWGLRPIPWLICIGFGFGSLLWRFIVVPIPEKNICPAVRNYLET